MGQKKAHNLKDLLNRAHAYIKFEDKLLVDGGSWGLRIPKFGRASEKDYGKRTRAKALLKI